MPERKSDFQKQSAVDDRRSQPRAGSDQERTVEVTLQEAYTGTTRLVTLASGRCFAAKIPPGVATGTTVRYTGYGKRGNNGGSRGDLYLVINVRPCSRFARRGNDLYHQCKANLAELALGTEIHIRTVDGKLLGLTIPPGTLPGQRFRLAGRGMPWLGQPDERGDLYVTVNMKRPQNLSQRQRKLLEELSRSRDADPVARTPDDTHWQTDEIIGLVIIAVMFVVGIGAGLLLYWLILD